MIKFTEFTVADYGHTQVWCILVIMPQHVWVISWDGGWVTCHCGYSRAAATIVILKDVWKVKCYSCFSLWFIWSFFTLLQRHSDPNHSNSTVFSAICSAHNKENIETGPFWGNSHVTDIFPSQMDSNVERGNMLWCHRERRITHGS